MLVFVTLSIVLGANTFFLSWGFISFHKNLLQNKTKLVGERLRDEVSRTLNLGMPLESLEGLDESCRDIIDANKEIGYCMLVDSENRILYHNDPLLAGRFLKDPGSVRASHSIQSLVQPRIEDGVKYYDISVPIFDSEQRLLGSIRLGLKQAAVVSDIYPLLWETVLVAIFTFIITSVLMMLFINKKIVTPIVELSASASLIAQGELTRRLTINSKDEVGQLAQSFNRMAESLKDREERIQQNYRDMEKSNAHLKTSYAKLESTAGELELKSRHLNEKVGELSFLHDATDRLRVSVDLDDILASVCRDITEGLGYERVLAALVSEELKALEEKVSLNFDGKERELLAEPLETNGVFSAAVMEHTVQYVAQASLDPKVPARLVELLDLKEFAVIPMVGKDRCVGVLLIDNRKSLKPMRKDKLDIVSTFASTAAMAVENAYLYKQLMDNLETVERANRELMSLDQTKTNFLSLASHELRTPLVSVMGYLNLMLAGDLGTIYPEQREMLEIAMNGASRLRDIIEDLLMVAKIEGGKLPLKLKWISLSDVVTAALSEVTPFLGQRNVQISKQGLDLMPKIEGDFERLQQCFTNMIGNAIKFTPDGGMITISSRKVKVDKDGNIKPVPFDNSILSSDTFIEVVIEDTGIGINSENFEKIFEKFFEAGDVDSHSTGKVKFLGGGTGLGLSISKGIVNAHNGKIWVESECEDVEKCPGSRFKILLPLKQPNVTVDIPISRKEIPSTRTGPTIKDDEKRPKILLVEDDEDTIVFTRLVLEKKFQVVLAGDGFDGLKKAFLERPEVILLDVWMRGLDGFEVCRILKENKKTADIPIAMFTAAAQKHEMERGYKAGADDYITKPFTPSELMLRVGKLIKRSANVS